MIDIIIIIISCFYVDYVDFFCMTLTVLDECISCLGYHTGENIIIIIIPPEISNLHVSKRK